MKVVVPHGSTQQAIVPVMDQALDHLFGAAGSSSIQILDQKKIWDGSVMIFSFTGKLGFIVMPLAGTLAVDTTDVTVEVELPPLLKTFVGEEKVRSIVDENVRRMISERR
jgi:hypothetical protein